MAVHNFSVWLRTGSNPADCNRFRSQTENYFIKSLSQNHICYFLTLSLFKYKKLNLRVNKIYESTKDAAYLGKEPIHGRVDRSLL